MIYLKHLKDDLEETCDVLPHIEICFSKHKIISKIPNAKSFNHNI